MVLKPEDAKKNEAVTAFIAELKHRREVAGVSQKGLAKVVEYTPSYVIPEGVGPCQGEFCRGSGCLRACVTGVSCSPDSCHVRGERPGQVKDRAGARPP